MELKWKDCETVFVVRVRSGKREMRRGVEPSKALCRFSGEQNCSLGGGGNSGSAASENAVYII